MRNEVCVTKINNGFTVTWWPSGTDECVYYAKDLAEVTNLLYQFFLLEKDDSKAGVVNS